MPDEATTPSAQAPTVDPIAAVAELLHSEVEHEAGVRAPAEKETTDQVDTELAQDDESEQDTDVEPSQEDNPAEEETEGDDDRTLSELIGLDSDQVSVDEESGDLLIATKVDGVATQLKFKEVLAGYQTQKSNTQRSQAIAKERKEFDQAAQAKLQEVQQGLEYNATLTQQLHNELLQEYQNTNWDALRQQDPAEYAARQQDQQARYNQVQALQQQIGQQKEQANIQARQEITQARNTFLGQQRDMMLDNHPEWRDAEKMKTDMTDIRTFLTDTYGFSDEDLVQVVEARQVDLVRDAMAYRKGSKVAAKKVAKRVPKMQKAKVSAKKNKVTRLDRLTKAAQSAKGGDKRRLEIDAVAELLSS